MTSTNSNRRVGDAAAQKQTDRLSGSIIVKNGHHHFQTQTSSFARPTLIGCDSNPPIGAGDAAFDIGMIDGEALVYALGRNKQKYDALVKHYRARGATDSQIVNAMVNARGLASTVRLGGWP
jgi:hypothetical protein